MNFVRCLGVECMVVTGVPLVGFLGCFMEIWFVFPEILRVFLFFLFQAMS